jgi:hypothetical protein
VSGSFTPRPLYLRGKNPNYLLDRSLLAPEPAWTIWREKFYLYRDSNSDRSVVVPVSSRYTDCTSSALHIPIEVKIQWSYTSSHPCVFMTWCLHREGGIFTLRLPYASFCVLMWERKFDTHLHETENCELHFHDVAVMKLKSWPELEISVVYVLTQLRAVRLLSFQKSAQKRNHG